MIEINGLSKVFGTQRAVDDVSFRVEEGEIMGFLGPNGAGKSTTMNILTGYLSATSGTCRVNGIDILENPLEAKRNIGFLPEMPPLYTDMTVKEYLSFVYLMEKSTIVLTDSGGIQEEACALGVPTLVARDTTERGEGISTGGIRLIGTQKNEVSREFAELLDNRNIYEKMRFSANPYGDGTASAQICQILSQKLALFTEL